VWRHISQSVQGLHHSAEGTPCQDSCLVRVLGEGAQAALVACVADGAGYSQHSDVGSRLACESIVQSAASYFQSRGSFAGLETGAVLLWCEAARKAISNYAEGLKRELREYATTLCAALVSAEGSVFFQIGDGAIIVRKNAAFGVVFWPQSGEYINTTNFLTSKEFRDHLQVMMTPGGFLDVALLTDGMERLVLRFDSFTPHPPFFQPLFGALRAAADPEELAEDLRQLLQSDSVRNKTDDDKTLVLASRVADETSSIH
jgi:hypothetical protein